MQVQWHHEYIVQMLYPRPSAPLSKFLSLDCIESIYLALISGLSFINLYFIGTVVCYPDLTVF